MLTASRADGPRAPIRGLVARYVAAAFVGHLVVLAAAVSLVRFAIAPALTDLSLQPSAWVALGPLALLAAAWTARRLDRSGEALAIDVSGTPRARAAGLAVLVTLLVQVGLGRPGTRVEGAVERSAVAQALVATSGDLLVTGADAGYLWRAGAGAPVRVDSGSSKHLVLPPGFVPAPQEPTRLRRQLFVVGTPLIPTGHPLDPTLARWIWLVANALGVGIVLGAERGRRRWLAGVLLSMAALAV